MPLAVFLSLGLFAAVAGRAASCGSGARRCAVTTSAAPAAAHPARRALAGAHRSGSICCCVLTCTRDFFPVSFEAPHKPLSPAGCSSSVQLHGAFSGCGFWGRVCHVSSRSCFERYTEHRPDPCQSVRRRRFPDVLLC